MKEIYDKLSAEIKNKLKSCELLILDFDGTLTNNKVYVSQDGKESIRADRSDGLGLEFLKKYTNTKL